MIKEDGETSNGEYFHEVIHEENVFPFMRNEENLEDVDQITLLHDKAPRFKATQTQKMFRNSGFNLPSIMQFGQ